MSTTIEIKIPDIGDVDEVDVIEVLVAENDQIEAEQSLITVESDKASMEIPASHAGTVKTVSVKVGDKVTEGMVILLLDAQDDADSSDQAPADDSTDDGAEQNTEATAASATDSKKEDAKDAGQDKASEPAAASSGEKGSSVVQAGKERELASVPPERQSPTASFAATDVAAKNLPHAS